jgi:hypothetical protein
VDQLRKGDSNDRTHQFDVTVHCHVNVSGELRRSVAGYCDKLPNSSHQIYRREKAQLQQQKQNKTKQNNCRQL